MIGSYRSLKTSNGVCTICLHELKEQRFVGKVNCGHTFCYTCIETWCFSASTCCSCRSNIKSIEKIERFTYEKALEIQNDLHTEEKEKVTTNEDVGLLVHVCTIKKQIQKSVVDGDELVALQAYFEEEPDIGLVDSLPTDACEKCSTGGLLLVCDACDKNFHMTCLSLPLQSIPDGLWICEVCENEREQEKETKTEFIQSKKKRKVFHIDSDDSDEGPIDLLQKYSQRRILQAQANNNNHNKKATKKKSRINKGLLGYKDDGFVVPVHLNKK
jgi:hypothetical protein